MTPDLVLDLQCRLGEGPFWDVATESLYFVDIEGHRVYRYQPASEQLEHWDTGQRVGFAIPIEGDHDQLVIGTEDGVKLLDCSDGSLRDFCDPESGKPGNRFNDAACGPDQRLYAGTMSLKAEPGAGALYRIDPDGQWQTVADQITISNGLDWTADGKRMYYVDTPTSQVDLFDFDIATGTARNRRKAFTIPQENGRPDGFCCDENDRLWMGHFGGGAVRCYDPANGTVLQTIEIPAAAVTSCCFGGPELDTLYITTARVGTSEEQLAKMPHAGGIFAVRPGVQGRPQYRFGPIEK